MQAIELSNAVWSLRLLPEWGGRVAALKAEGLDILLPVSSSVFNPLDWPRAGAYPLMPYCNRLKDARLSFAGQTYQLPAHPAAQPHTLHGISHTQAWEVVSADQQQVLIACTYQGPHWPWMFRAEQRFTLEGNCLRITLALVNLGDTEMPAGFGLHPYFQRHPGMRARYSRGRGWLIDDQYLATGEFVDAVADITLQADDPAAVAHYQSRWDGKLNLEYREGRLAISASSPLSHFVAFAPANAPFVCLEPVSHLADAFNRPRSDWREVGTHVLEPGARMTATLDFEWHGH
ncbi:aldose 1-epimerase [Pseudomonas putida]|uniref:aldose 1-epimerase n=1 Tax=Pseudomonas putida TaxID=303 RepID=UPI002167712F|nr:aldose 1-epimerase [Pseudomonas putida]MCS4061370.1 aldose 1-epimerase [Pseudomonas putida]